MNDNQGNSGPAGDGGGPVSTPVDVPVQIAQMLQPAVRLAGEANLPFLAYLLNMALQEANRVAEISASLRAADHKPHSAHQGESNGRPR